MDIDKILTGFIIIMFQRNLNKFDEVWVFSYLRLWMVLGCCVVPCDKWSTMLTKMPNFKLNKKQRDKGQNNSL